MKKIKMMMMIVSLICLGCTEISAVPPVTQTVSDCILLGDSITEIWYNTRQGFFRENNLVSKGIGGQTTGQMLERFADDVVYNSPKAVSIMAGINDIAQNQGYISNEDIMKNIASMAQKAHKAGIKVILCSVLPADVIGWNVSVRPAPLVRDLNSKIEAYAKQQKFTYLDYYSEFVTSTGGLPSDLTTDGVHVTDKCYEQMEEMFLATLKKVLDEK